MNYLEKSKVYWQKGYAAVNVDHFVFQFYGRILNRSSDWGAGSGSLISVVELPVTAPPIDPDVDILVCGFSESLQEKTDNGAWLKIAEDHCQIMIEGVARY